MQDEADVIRNTLRKDHDQDAGRGAAPHLQPAAPGRAAARRFGPRDPQQAVLQPQALRPGARRPLQAEPEAPARVPAAAARTSASGSGLGVPDLDHDDAVPRGLHRHHQVPAAAAHQRRGDRGRRRRQTDDIDHLGNRRVRSVGELLANQFNIGLARMARIIRERMSLQDAEQVTPYDLINSRTISAVIQTFFGSASCRSSWTRPTRWPS